MVPFRETWLSVFFHTARQPSRGSSVYWVRTIIPMQQNPSIDRSQVIFMGGLISAVLAVVLLMLAYVPL